MNRDHVYSDESKYRCFVYEKSGKGDNKTVKMAQSLSATCSGLWSPLEGYRTFDMNRGRLTFDLFGNNNFPQIVKEGEFLKFLSMKQGLYLPWFTQCDILTIKA